MYFEHSKCHPLEQPNPKVHLALIAMLVRLLQWPDTSFCHHLFTGFPAVGSLAPCRIWDSQPVDFISLQDVLQQGKDDGQQITQHLRSSTDDDVIHEAGAKDEANGWCSAPFVKTTHERCGPFSLVALSQTHHTKCVVK